jgi:outer membrane lipoprotein SlyB
MASKKYPKDFLNNMKNMTAQSPTDVVTESSKGTAVGSVVGAGVGLIIAYQRKQSLWLGAFIGALAGGLISNYFINH